MSESRVRSYRLPAGDVSEGNLACTIVYYPDRTEYRQALVSSLLYLGSWLAWQRDDDKRGKDAAASWKIANDLTLECLYMGCLVELQANVAAILALLQQQAQCCDENTTTGPSSEYETEIEPGVGDDPDYYGETAVADWEEWLEYLCYSANAWVDQLVLQAGNWEVYLNAGGSTIGLLAASIVAISFFVVGGFVSIPILMIGFAALAAGMTAALFGDAADDLEAARVDIVCTILQGGDVAAAVEDALSSGAAWDLFYTLIDYESAVAILYEGGDGETYLDPVKDASCDCEQVGEYLVFTDFETGLQGWLNDGGSIVAKGMGGGDCWQGRCTFSDWITMDLETLIGIEPGGVPDSGDYILIHRIVFWYKMTDVDPGGHLLHLYRFQDGGTQHTTYPWKDAYTEVVLEFDPSIKFTAPRNVLRFTVGGADWQILVDNITIDYDYVEI